MNFSEIKNKNRLAMDTILNRPTKGIPTGLVHIMQHDVIERIAGVSQGDYIKNPEVVYLKMLKNIGVNIVDQYLALNPLSMGQHGYEKGSFNATTGAEVILDGMAIDSPEAVAQHLEKFEFPKLIQNTKCFDEVSRVNGIMEAENRMQEKLGEDILKTGYNYAGFPRMAYGEYGYANYFMAFVLYPEVIEQHFKLQADYYLLNNKAASRAYKEGNLPPLYRLDHDMADSRGILVDIKLLDRIWFPYFAQSLEPLLKVGLKMIWHCDGNLMQMVPRLLDAGIKGFQGFQYEDGMDYEKICRMKTQDGEELIIEGGVSVTRTLPFGTPDDVRKEMKWLVESGPETGLFLSTSSSVAPGTPWENIKTMIEGFRYYREHGRE